jgi:putative heme-binding domain-containing protein
MFIARRFRFRHILLVAALCGPTHLAAQDTPSATQNPLAGDKKAIEQGRVMFRGRCAVCHGIDAKGYRGTDLTSGEWMHGGSDTDLFRTISRGVPGTEMPPSPNLSDDEIWMLISYLRSLTIQAPAPEPGDARRGEQLFWAREGANCGQCHMIGGRGGRLGPNLSRIGAARSPSALEREIRQPGEVIPVGFESVSVVTRDGRRIRGVRKNEDTFSIQLMTGNEDLLSFSKRDLTSVVADPQSLMPSYGPERLSGGDLQDLIRYLRTLKGVGSASPR